MYYTGYTHVSSCPMSDIKRIGFACKYLCDDQTQSKKLLAEQQLPYNTRGTTIKWLNQQSRSQAEERLWDIMQHNVASFGKLVEYAGTLPPKLRMVRLSSDCLPAYTESTWRYFWQLPDVKRYYETHFAQVGDLARQHDVRLSFHPGQFCCIVSDRPDVVERSIDELEYHAAMAVAMGYGRQFQDFKINVHLSGRNGPAAFDAAYQMMSPQLQNCLTLENDEYQIGLDSLLPLADRVAIVLDLHHHYINTGEYISAADPRIKRVKDSWRGVRPVIHYSQSREDLLEGFSTGAMPILNELIAQGYKKTKLRAHSDYMWNQAVNQWAKTHSEWADVMVEAKAKNLAAIDLYHQWQA